MSTNLFHTVGLRFDRESRPVQESFKRFDNRVGEYHLRYGGMDGWEKVRGGEGVSEGG